MNPLNLSNKTYDFLKPVVLVLLPALATLYPALAEVWGWGMVTEVVVSITAFDTFLGTILGVSSKQYNRSDEKYDGAIVRHVTEEGKKVFTLEIGTDPDEIQNMESILFKVVDSEKPS